jgi:hypothetical protein
LNKFKVLLLMVLFALPALGSAPQTESQTPTTITSMMTVSAETRLVNATRTSETTEFTNASDTLSASAISPLSCFHSSWGIVANSSQLISATAKSTQGLNVYLTSLKDWGIWLSSSLCVVPPKSVQVLFVAINVTSVTVNYRVPQNVQPNANYELMFVYHSPPNVQAAALLTVSVIVASTEVYAASTTLYSTSFQQSIYSTVTAEQGFFSQYGMLIVAVLIAVLIVAALLVLKMHSRPKREETRVY